MPTERGLEHDPSRAHGDEREAHRAVRVGAVLADRVVRPLQDLDRRGDVVSSGADGVARETGESGGFDALPADVADHDAPPVATQREEVVEVAADLEP